MINFPSGKINLGLQVLRRRSDGYHDLETVMLELPFCDVLECIETPTAGFSTSGLPISGNGNLVLDAKNIFEKKYPLPSLSFHLHKLIPMGAGLGGGSSDAAFALKMLRDEYHPTVSDWELMDMASSIGSDCAFFIQGGGQFATGRGEILEPIELALSGIYVYLIHVGIHISTAEAYAGVQPNATRTSVRKLIELPIHQWKDALKNDFEDGAFNTYPVLADVKARLYEQGAIYAAMTGSGSTIFGLFENPVSKIDWPFLVEFEQMFKI